jgi:histidinol phosphatase-like PHP family hydrolase
MEGFVIPMADKLVEFRTTFPIQLRKAFPWMSEKKAQAIANTFKLPDAMDALDYSCEEYDGVVAEFMMKSFEQLLENPEFEKLTHTLPVIIAHPFYPCGTIGRVEQEYNLIDKVRMRQAFLKAAKMGIAFDVNVNTYRFMDDLEREPLVKVMRLAKECGVKFAFGTDAHRVDVLPTINKGDAIAEAVGITNDDIFELVK